MVRDYSRGANRPTAFKCSSAGKKVALEFSPGFNRATTSFLSGFQPFQRFPQEVMMETLETVMRAMMVSPEHPVETGCE
jgi:hypothetical protein